MQQEQSKVEERLQRSTDDSREKNELTERLHLLQNENSALSAKYDDLNANKEDEIQILNNTLSKLREVNFVKINSIILITILNILQTIKHTESHLIEEKSKFEEQSKSAQNAKVELEQKLQSTLAELQELQVKTEASHMERITLVQSVKVTEDSRAELQNKIAQLTSEQEQLNSKCAILSDGSLALAAEKNVLQQKLMDVKIIELDFQLNLIILK